MLTESQQQDIERYKNLIQLKLVNIKSIKSAVAEQDAIIKRYEQLIRDIENGTSTSYTVDGLTHGIEQANGHIVKLKETQNQERENIQQIRQMIDDIIAAEEVKDKVEVHIELEYDTED